MSSVKGKILNAKQYIVFRNKHIIFPSCLLDFVVRCTCGLGRKVWHLQKKPNKVFWLVRIHPFSWLTYFCGNLTCMKSMLVIRWNEAKENKKVTEELGLFRGGSAVMGTFHVRKWSIISAVCSSVCSLQCVFGKVPFSSWGEGLPTFIFSVPSGWLTDYANSTHLDFTECHLGKIEKEGIPHELTFPMLTKDTGQVFFEYVRLHITLKFGSNCYLINISSFTDYFKMFIGNLLKL